MAYSPDRDELDEPETVAQVFKPETVAQVFKVSVRTVQRLAEAGEIPSYRVGGQFRFDLAEVRAALRVEKPA